MKKITKRVLSLLLAVMTVASMIPIMAVSSSAASENGMTFKAEDYYQTSKEISGELLSFEAEIAIPNTYTKRPGLIIGNYGHPTSTKTKFTFEIKNSGSSYYPSLYRYGLDFKYETDETGTEDTSKPIDVRRAAGTFAHVAVTIDKEAGYAHCYIDGVRKSTINLSASQKNASYAIDTKLVVGGDYRGPHCNHDVLNEQYFKGNIKNVKVYTDVRTPDEIAADAASFSADTDTNLVLAYDLTKDDFINDLSENGNTLEWATHYGRSFAAGEQIEVNKVFTAEPYTFTASIYAPIATSRTGLIFGNYDAKNKAINFEISNNGQPRLYFNNSNGGTTSLVFDEIDIRKNGWVDLAKNIFGFIKAS